MIKSLRWRLQIWHAVILTIAITAFGAAFYFQLRRSTIGEIDLELLASARVLEGALRTLPPRPRENGFPFPSPELDLFAGPRPRGNRGGDRPPPNDVRPDQPRPLPPASLDNRLPPANRLESVLSVPGGPARGPRDEPAYFAVFASDGSLLKSEPPNLEVEWSTPSRPVEYRSLRDQREVWVRGPNGTLIVVGREVRHHLDRLTRSLLQLLFAGTAVSALGLVGGWWLSGRAIQPIEQISATASSITASNLEQRIDTSAMDAELQRLGGILNSMFGRLQNSFQQQSRFTADASHELRTPLAVILSHCELALNRSRSAEEYQQTIATCQKAGTRMRGLVEDLLTLARADAGKLEIQTSQVDLHGIAAEVAAMLEPAARLRNVTIHVVGEACYCEGDAARLSQVVTNLVSNAIHYNRDSGTVNLNTESDGKEAVLRVQDTGCGIPESAIPRLFDRFFRVDEARSRQTGGSGLGLAICKSIIDAHGGQILITSKRDTGSTFEIRIPKLLTQTIETKSTE